MPVVLPAQEAEMEDSLSLEFKATVSHYHVNALWPGRQSETLSLSFFFFEMESCSVAQAGEQQRPLPRLTATSASQVQAILLV